MLDGILEMDYISLIANVSSAFIALINLIIVLMLNFKLEIVRHETNSMKDKLIAEAFARGRRVRVRRDKRVHQIKNGT